MRPSPNRQFVAPRSEATCKFGGLRFEELSYDADLWLPSHAHKEAFLELCLVGTTEEFWGKQTFVRGPSTLNYFPIGAQHTTRFKENVRTFQIVMNATWLERVREVAPLVDTLTNYPNGSPIRTAARLYHEFQCRDSLSPLVLEGMLLELLGEMSRDATSLAGNACPRWLKHAREFLHAYFTESVPVEAIATAVGVHPSHLMRGFRQYFRCTVGDYVRRLRVEQACQMLSTSDTPSSQIAVAVGFVDQSHFSRTFKICTGLTPTEFRKISGHASLRQELIL
jgi:AraC family transcriptional regulator